MTTSRSLPNYIPVLFTKGTPYEVGFNVGRCFAEQIKTYHDRQGKFLRNMVKFYETEEGRKHLEPYLTVSEERFPNYMEEMRGTADGANMSYDKIVVSNFWRELSVHPMNTVSSIFKSTRTEPIGCTDIILNNGTTKVLGHNEDGELTMNDIDYIICAEVGEYTSLDGRVFPAEKFVAHTYPGMLPGGCFGFNHHGLGYSVNTCWSDEIPERRLGESIHMRSLLKARNRDEFFNILKDDGYGSTTGIGINAGFLSDPNMYSFEVAPNMGKTENKVAMVTVSNGNSSTTEDASFYCRTNHPILMETKPCYSSKGTNCRYDTVHRIPNRKTRQDVLQMLGDTSHPEFPVFRQGLTKSDQVSGTACTSLIDFNEKTLNVYKNSPRDAGTPVLRLPLTIFG